MTMHSIIGFHVLAGIFTIGVIVALICESVYTSKEKEVVQCDEKKSLND